MFNVGATGAPSRLTPDATLRRVEAVVNVRSGGVGPDPAVRLTAITRRYGLDVEPRCAEPHALRGELQAAVAAGPDLLILIAGDGTAAMAADLCGMTGPLLAPLPGGTMNMLPHALYGRSPWPQALEATLARGVPRVVSGGEVAGRSFYVAAILGAPAMWAEAREALRRRRLKMAYMRARRAVAHAFSGRLRFSLDGRARRKVEALTLMCPLVSRAMTDDVALEAAALDPRGAMDAFRLGLMTALGVWRNDPVVTVEPCVQGLAWARGRIPVILDGEPHRLDSPVSIRFRREAFRALAPAPSGATMQAQTDDGSGTAAERPS